MPSRCTKQPRRPANLALLGELDKVLCGARVALVNDTADGVTVGFRGVDPGESLAFSVLPPDGGDDDVLTIHCLGEALLHCRAAPAPMCACFPAPPAPGGRRGS